MQMSSGSQHRHPAQIRNPCRPGRDEPRFRSTRYAIAMPGFFLAAGSVVLVGISAHQLDEGARSWLDEQRTRVQAEAITKGRPAPGSRIAVFGSDDEGTRAVWDLAWR